MKIALVTQDDSYYIPRLIAGVLAEREHDVAVLTMLPGETQAGNIRKYVQFMGGLDFTRQAARYAVYRLLNLVLPRGIGDHYWSVGAVARRHRTPVLRMADVNDERHLARLEELGIDLVVSIAAPQIFGPELLALPRHGCINIHNALLPDYQGMLPSFWVLANDEEVTGTTVHFMNEAIDAGDIILQERVKISGDDTLHSLVCRTKIEIGPPLVLEAISRIEDGTVEAKPMNAADGSYFSFPNREAVARFRRHGRKFR
jgi:methionyl-tRNA formyltransferase